MTAQKGKDLLFKVDSDGAGSFATVAGLRARTLAFNAASVDVTDQESAGRWRELLEGAGIKTARVSGSGIFKDASSDNQGRPAEVKLHAKSSSGVTIELWQSPAEAIAEGDNFRIVAGCDKQFSTCRAKFANTVNFRGFPHVPGNDFMLSVASRGGRNDGTKLNR